VFQLLYEFDESQQLKLARLAFDKVSRTVNGPEQVKDLDLKWKIRPFLGYGSISQKSTPGASCTISLIYTGGFKDARLVVAGVPGPRQFVELVIAMCYPDYYRVHRLDESGKFGAAANLSEVNVCCRDAFNEEEESYIIHIRVP